MGDHYNVNQAGAVGPNASATDNTFNQLNLRLPSDTNYEQLAIELRKLKELLLKKASNAEHYKAIGDVVKAEEAANEKNDNKIVKSLLSAGKWVWDFASKVGVSVVSKIVTANLGQ